MDAIVKSDQRERDSRKWNSLTRWGVRKEKRSRTILLRQMSRIRYTARKTNEEAEKEIKEQ